MSDEQETELAQQRDSLARMQAGLALCIWRLHADGTRTLMATPVDADFAARRAKQWRERGMTIEVVEQVPPYGHTDDRRLWEPPFPHPALEAKIAFYATDQGLSRATSAALAMDTLPTDELLRIARQHADAGAPDDDLLALLEEVLRLRARTAGQARSNQDSSRLASLLTAVLYRTDPDLCHQVLDAGGFTIHDFFGDDRRPGELMEDFIDETYEEATEQNGDVDV